jgi:hypothetical protein
MKEYLLDDLNEIVEKEELFYSVTDHAMEKEIENGFDDLEEIEKNAFMIGKLFMEINNGGFDQYFVNTDGQYARATVDFLDNIGEECFSKLLEEAISSHKAVIPDDQKMEEFDKIDKKFYYLKTDDFELLYEKFAHYLRGNINHVND